MSLSEDCAFVWLGKKAMGWLFKISSSLLLADEENVAMFLPILSLGLCVVWVKHYTRDVYLTITELPYVISFLVRLDLACLSFLLCL